MLFSCQGEKKGAQTDAEKMITQQSDTLTMIYTKNGKKDYRFYTPLMERYELARDPYMEFRYGINIITYDSLGSDASNLVADYAIFYERRELWECRGNVVGKGEDGRTLYTQQLFWDQKTDKVYSNVDCKIVDGTDTFVGEGFESDSEFNDWVFRESEGRMWVDASQATEEEIAEAEAEEKAEQERIAEEQEKQRQAEETKRKEHRERRESQRTRPNQPRPNNNLTPAGRQHEAPTVFDQAENSRLHSRPNRDGDADAPQGPQRPQRPQRPARPNDGATTRQ